MVAEGRSRVRVTSVPTDAEHGPDELSSYAEQEAPPQEDGPASAEAQRRDADHVDEHREGEGDPLSGGSRNVHPESRRGGGGHGRPDRSAPRPSRAAGS